MNKSHPSRRNHRVAAIAAKRFNSQRRIVTYYECEDIGYVSGEGNYLGGTGERYRLGDVARRMIRVAMCNTGQWPIYRRRNALNTARELRLEGY